MEITIIETMDIDEGQPLDVFVVHRLTEEQKREIRTQLLDHDISITFTDDAMPESPDSVDKIVEAIVPGAGQPAVDPDRLLRRIDSLRREFEDACFGKRDVLVGCHDELQAVSDQLATWLRNGGKEPDWTRGPRATRELFERRHPPGTWKRSR